MSILNDKQSLSETTKSREQRPDSTPPFGKNIARQFLFDPSFRNLNHGSFGSIPKTIQAKMRSYQDMAEAKPDPFIRYEYPRRLDESREAVAELLRVPTDTVVFVSNATVGLNAVLRNLLWDEDGRDEILYFSTVYGGVGKIIDYVVDTRNGLVSSRCIQLSYPLEDDDVVGLFHAAILASKSEGKRPKVCVFDVVSSLPGICFPYKQITRACQETGIVSVVDGAQGVGLVDLNLGTLNPDYFVSNCHKWLHVPRGCAVLYVPLRNQHLLRSTIPTSHGYVPKSGARFNPLPPSSKSVFVNNFEFVGTIDNAPYLCVKDSILWRQEALGGEATVRAYTTNLAQAGGKRVAEILGTEILDNSRGTLTNCAMVNVALPLWIGNGPDGQAVIDSAEAIALTQWMLQTLMDDYNTFIVVYAFNSRFWTRLSAQVYLDMDDFEYTGRALADLCKRVQKNLQDKAKL